MLNNDVQSPPRLVCMVHSGQLKAWGYDLTQAF